MTWLAAAGWWGFGFLCGLMVRPVYLRLWPFLHPVRARRIRELNAELDRRHEELNQRAQAMQAKYAPHTVNGNARRPGA